MASKDKTGKTGMSPQIDEVAQQMTGFMTTVVKMQGHMFDALMKQNIEMLDFVRTRFERDRALVAKIAATEDPVESQRLLGEFWQKAVSDYTDESGKMTGMVAELTSDAARQMRDDAFDAMPSTKDKKPG